MPTPEGRDRPEPRLRCFPARQLGSDSLYRLLPRLTYNGVLPLFGVPQPWLQASASDSTGALYGTNEFSLYFGSVFKLTPPSSPGGSWTEQDLYDFKGNNHGIIDGAVPLGGCDR